MGTADIAREAFACTTTVAAGWAYQINFFAKQRNGRGGGVSSELFLSSTGNSISRPKHGFEGVCSGISINVSMRYFGAPMSK